MVQGSGAVLRELLLPGGEHVAVQLKLVTEVGDGDSLGKMPLQDGELPLRRLVLAGLSHAKPLRVSTLTRDFGLSLSV
jgi:hypothetical protein